MKSTGIAFTIVLATTSVLAPQGRASVKCGDCPFPPDACASETRCAGSPIGGECGDVGDPGTCFPKGGPCGSPETDEIWCCECRPGRGTTFTDFGGTILPIDDNNPADLTLTLPVTQTGEILDMVVQIVGQHTRLGDLVIRLTHGNTTVTLMDRPGLADGQSIASDGFGCDADLSCERSVYFWDRSSRPIECDAGSECALCFSAGQVHEAIYRPNQALSAFSGQDVFGPWILSVSDIAQGEVGALCGWGIIAALGEPVPALPASWGSVKASYR